VLRCCAPARRPRSLRARTRTSGTASRSKKTITWPARQIAINAGEDGSVVVGKIQGHLRLRLRAQTGEFGNLVSKGIIDPTKVMRIALQDAPSIAGLLITTEAVVAELPKKETAPRHASRWRHVK
jgi:chaperonin GroEL